MQTNFTDLSFLAKEDNRHVYILDTNVVLHDPASIFRFEEHVVLISFSVLEEIDAKKMIRVSATMPGTSVKKSRC